MHNRKREEVRVQATMFQHAASKGGTVVKEGEDYFLLAAMDMKMYHECKT